MSRSRRQTCPNRCILTTQCVPTVCLSIGITIRTIELIPQCFALAGLTNCESSRLRGDAIDNGRDIRPIIRFLICTIERQQLFSHATDCPWLPAIPGFPRPAVGRCDWQLATAESQGIEPPRSNPLPKNRWHACAIRA